MEKNVYDRLAGSSLALTVCCEDSRHWSVAFIEETARTKFKNGNGVSRVWCLDTTVVHRDVDILIVNTGDSTFAEKQLRTNKSNVEFRQRERRQKRDKERYPPGRSISMASRTTESQ